MFIWRTEMWDGNAPSHRGTHASAVLAFGSFRPTLEELVRDNLGQLDVELNQERLQLAATWNASDQVTITGELVRGADGDTAPMLGDFRDLHSVRVLLRRWMHLNEFVMDSDHQGGEQSLWGSWTFRRSTFV